MEVFLIWLTVTSVNYIVFGVWIVAYLVFIKERKSLKNYKFHQIIIRSLKLVVLWLPFLIIDALE